MQDQPAAILGPLVAEPQSYELTLPNRTPSTRHRLRRVSSLTLVLEGSPSPKFDTPSSASSLATFKEKSQSTVSLPILHNRHGRGPESSGGSMSDPFGEMVEPPSRAQTTVLPQSGEASGSKLPFEEIYPVTPQYMMRLRYERTYFQFVSCLPTMLPLECDSDVRIPALKSTKTTLVPKYELCRPHLLCKSQAILCMRGVY